MGDVVVVGGTGFYGRYLVDDLLRYTDASILVVARRPGRSSIGRVRTAAVDHRDAAALSRVVSGAAVVVHCAGPFQFMPLGPLRAALAARVPYVDISEDRGFRRAVLELSAGTDIPVLTGASVVPAMEAAAAATLAGEFDDLIAIRSAAAPDTRRHRGDAMFRAMLHGAGVSFLAPRDGVSRLVRGWSEPEWVEFPPPLGRRLVYQVYEMADLDVLVEQFGVGTVSFKAGCEFAWLNRTLALASATRARFGRPRRPERFTSAVRGVSWLAGRFGDEAGGVVFEVTGHRDGQVVRRALGLSAARSGGRIPSLMAGIAVSEILAGRVDVPPSRLWSGLARRDVRLWRRSDDSGWVVF